MTGKSLPWENKLYFFETFWILSKTGFLNPNFGSRYASKSIKGSKDADFGLVSQKNWAKPWVIGLAPRA